MLIWLYSGVENPFILYLKSKISLTADEAELIAASMNEKQLKKGEVLQERDRVSKYMYFVASGAVRSFLMKDHNEVTWNFYFDNAIATDFQSYLMESPSPLTFVAIDDTTIISISKMAAEDLYRKKNTLVKVGNLLAENAFLDMRKRVESFLLLTPEERYLSLMENNRELVMRLPNKDIATYLGITPQSLSRMKQRVFKKK
ncbi:MAG: Crp/Fnr family transcriptional regulator [Bacteroidota bacterium]